MQVYFLARLLVRGLRTDRGTPFACNDVLIASAERPNCVPRLAWTIPVRSKIRSPPSAFSVDGPQLASSISIDFFFCTQGIKKCFSGSYVAEASFRAVIGRLHDCCPLEEFSHNKHQTSLPIIVFATVGKNKSLMPYSSLSFTWGQGLMTLLFWGREIMAAMVLLWKENAPGWTTINRHCRATSVNWKKRKSTARWRIRILYKRERSLGRHSRYQGKFGSSLETLGKFCRGHWRGGVMAKALR